MSITGVAQIATLPLDTTIQSKQTEIRIKAIDLDSNCFVLSSTVSASSITIDTIDRSLVAITFPDFNHDGYHDILVIRLGNVDQHLLYLFELKSQVFKEIENYESYPEAVQLKSNPQYYYSYQAGGCSDYNWDSHLFKLVDYKIVPLGHIYGQGCEAESNIIEVYKITHSTDHSERLLEKLPYKKQIPTFEDKWDFIEKYWNKTYRKFE